MSPNQYLTAANSITEISDEGLRNRFGELFADAQRLIDDNEVSLVVLTARRLVCMYQVLVDAGMPQLTGCPVVSDRYFDSNPIRDWAKDNVLVLDDSVIVGTTLEGLHRHLKEECKVASVRCRAVCLDAEQHVPYLVGPLELEGTLHRSSAQVEQFSLDIVRTLFVHQVPYFSDFPATCPVSFTVDGWTEWLSSGLWHIADVTAPMLADQKHHSFSCLPTEEVRKQILRRVPVALRSLMDTVKLRCYVSVEGDQVDVVFVPIAVVRPVKVRRVDDAITALRGGLPDGVDIDCQGWRAEAKHRVLQFFLSACVLAESWKQTRLRADVQPLAHDRLQHIALSTYFGQDFAAVAAAFDVVVKANTVDQEAAAPDDYLDEPAESVLLSKSEVRSMAWAERAALSTHDVPEHPDFGELTKIGLLYSHAVMAVFGTVHRRLETAQRQLISGMSGIREYREWAEDPTRRYLSQGLTATELFALLMPASRKDPQWQRSLMMLGVDAANDLGIVVPVTKLDRVTGVVYRSYRIGETAHLADRPLAELDLDDLDLVTKSALDSDYPMLPVTVPLSSWAQSPITLEPSSSLGWLSPFAGKKLIQAFTGTITNVTEDYVVAQLSDPASQEVRVARMRLDLLSEVDQAEVAPHRTILWAITQHDSPEAGRSRTSNVWLEADRAVQLEGNLNLEHFGQAL